MRRPTVWSWRAPVAVSEQGEADAGANHGIMAGISPLPEGAETAPHANRIITAGYKPVCLNQLQLFVCRTRYATQAENRDKPSATAAEVAIAGFSRS